MLSEYRLNGSLRFVTTRIMAHSFLNWRGGEVIWEEEKMGLSVIISTIYWVCGSLCPHTLSVKAVGAHGIGDQENKWGGSHISSGMVARSLSLGLSISEKLMRLLVKQVLCLWFLSFLSQLIIKELPLLVYLAILGSPEIGRRLWLLWGRSWI